jgi:hypothetical protein
MKRPRDGEDDGRDEREIRSRPSLAECQESIPTSVTAKTRSNDDGNTDLCSQCAKIDFKTAFSINVPGGNGVPVTGILRLMEEQCDFCKMIKSMLDAVDIPQTSPNDEGFHLWAFSAWTVLKLRLSNSWTTTAMDNALVVIQDRPVATAVRVAVRRRGMLLGAILPVPQPTESMIGKRLIQSGRAVEKDFIDYSLLRGWIEHCQTSNKNPTTSAIS